MESDNINDNFETPEQYIEKLNQLNGSVNLILDEFKKIYVVSKMNPDIQEYQQQYANIISNINQIQSSLFTISNNVQANIDDISQKLKSLNLLIEKEKTTNKTLKKKLGIIEHNNNAATEMIYNYKQIYNMNYLRNWALFLSTVLCIVTIGKVYKSQTV